ncbi:hypothetical protein NQ318_013393, partial [Aromia moschata]
MNVYPAHKFLNELNGLKRDVKRPKTVRAPDGPKRKRTLKKLILHESFTMRKFYAKMVPRLLSPEQKESRINICADILNNIDTDPSFLDTVILKATRFEGMEAVKVKATGVQNQLTDSSTALNNGKVVWSGVEIAKGSTLKAKKLLLVYPESKVKPALYVLGLWWGDLATRSNKRQLATGCCSGRITRSFESRYSDPVQEKMQRSLEQRMANKFCVKLEKSVAETIPMLKKAFAEGREYVNDENRAGRPSISSSDDNVKRVRDLLNTDRRLSVRLISETLDITKTIIHEIVSESLGMSKVCVKLVPK